MTLFILATIVVFVSTGICALVEAALYAVRQPYVRQLAESGNRSGKLLRQFKERMDYPISAILIFDTLLGFGGAAIAGSQARVLFGSQFVIWFSIGLSAMLLIVSQIIPKIVGVVYSRSVARAAAVPVWAAITLLFPFVWVIERFTRHLKPEEPLQRASEAEVKQMARMSAEEGSILNVEAELIQNSLELNDVRADKIMTSRKHVFSLPADITVKEAFSKFNDQSRTRIPISRADDESKWIGLVTSRDILTEMAKDNYDVKLGSIATKLNIVPADALGHVLLDAFLKHRQPLFAVQSDGRMIGIVTLSDVVEELVGDEFSRIEEPSIG